MHDKSEEICVMQENYEVEEKLKSEKIWEINKTKNYVK